MTRALTGARFAHASLMVDDVALSAAFLAEVLGFRTVFGPVEIGAAFSDMIGSACGETHLMQLEQPQDGITIEVISSAGVIGAGQSRPPVAHIAFVVADLDAALLHATRAGALALGKVTAFAEGRSAYLREPGGAVIEIEELFE